MVFTGLMFIVIRRFISFGCGRELDWGLVLG